MEDCYIEVVVGRWVGRHFGLIELEACMVALVVQKKHEEEVALPHLGPSKRILEPFSIQGCRC